MTIDELNQLQYLKKFIEHERDRLQTIRESLDVKSPIISDMPKSHGASDRIGDAVPDIVDEASRIEENLKKMTTMRDRLTAYIETIPNARIKLIITLRFIDGMSWDETADYMDKGDGKCTADNVRMAVTNYLKRGTGHVK